MSLLKDFYRGFVTKVTETEDGLNILCTGMRGSDMRQVFHIPIADLQNADCINDQSQIIVSLPDKHVRLSVPVWDRKNGEFTNRTIYEGPNPGLNFEYERQFLTPGRALC